MSKSNKRGIAANLLFLTTAMIWGLSIVAQRFGADHMTPFAFNGIRYLLGGTCMLPVILLFERHGTPWRDRRLLLSSLVTGVILFVASVLQQLGLTMMGNAGRAGFITGLYTVLVPILCLVLFRSRTHVNVWIGAVCAAVGLYLISVTDGSFSLSLGDVLVFIGAFFWAGHIVAIDRLGGAISSLRFACLQFLVCGVLSTVTALLLEPPIQLAAVRGAAIPLVYCSVMSTGVAYTLQIIGQKMGAHPAAAAIILSTETVFAGLGGMLLLHERMTVQGYIGCLLIFAGILLSQWWPMRKRKTSES